MKIIKLQIVAGARPNFMKVAPLLKAIDKYNQTRSPNNPHLETFLAHTGQHYDEYMSEIFFRELGIKPPDINLEVGSGSHAYQTANIMLKFEPVCLSYKPDWVIVVGDVNSTLVCSLVCAKIGIKIAHVEAGLRSFDRTMPEEINRIVTDALSDLLFTPSEDANANLLAEGIPESKIKLVGNIMIDSLIEKLPEVKKSRIIDQLGLSPHKYIYITLHRPSNVDDKEKLASIINSLIEISKKINVVYPVHPRAKKIISDMNLAKIPGNIYRLTLLDPIGYIDSLFLVDNARLVLTDSGGLQEEATYFRTPCLTLRPNTERPITIKVGSNQLTSLNNLIDDIQNILNGPLKRGKIQPLWDGKTSDRIIKEISSSIYLL